MQIEELKGKSADELKAIIGNGKKELLNLRFQKAAGELQSPARFREVRQTIARAFTVLNAPAAVAKPAKAAKAPKAPKAEKLAKAAPKAKTTKTKKAS